MKGGREQGKKEGGRLKRLERGRKRREGGREEKEREEGGRKRRERKEGVPNLAPAAAAGELGTSFSIVANPVACRRSVRELAS